VCLLTEAQQRLNCSTHLIWVSGDSAFLPGWQAAGSTAEEYVTDETDLTYERRSDQDSDGGV